MVSRRAAQAAAISQTPAQPAAPASHAQAVQALGALDALRRDRLLETMAVAAQELLRSSDLAASLQKIVERIGTTTGVDRAHIFLIDSEGDDGLPRQHYLWTVPGLATPADFATPSRPMAEIGLKAWIARLKRGEIIESHVSELDADARGFFERGGVKSVLAVPVIVDGRWLGIIGFDDCRSERQWSAAEIDTIKIVAELVGAAVERTAQQKALADANRIIESSPTILYRLAPEPPFALTFVSQNLHRYGYSAEDFLAKPNRWLELIAAEDIPGMMANLNLLVEAKADRTQIDFRLKKPDGSIVWLDSEGYALRDRTGKLTGIEGILSDVTERKLAERELTFSHILLTTAIECSPDAILIVGPTGRIIKFNQNFVALWGIPPQVTLPVDDEPLLATVASRMKNESEFLARVRYLYDHPEIQSHEELELKDGRIIDRHSGSLFDVEKNYLGRVWFFRDITEKRRAAEKIAQLARTDAVTGLANRTGFLDRLKLEFARARRGTTKFAVHYIDLDHFKDINDTLGHPTGDLLLRQVAARLTKCLRETDMVARFGGDEFAVLQDEVSDPLAIETLAAKICDAIAGPYTIAGSQVTTSASIGVVPYRDDIADADAMMMKADLALYRAKNDGRNRFRFHVAELDEQTRERIIIGEDLRHAVERGEFELFYQPQVELQSGAVVGLEALIRWNHPRSGLLLPETFIGVAETTGSILPIGDWVIAQACRQIKDWRDSGLVPPIVAVNLSGAQFKLAAHIDEIVLDNLARHGVAPGRLELELTETVLVETGRRYGETFKRLRQAGVRFAIDDFGTGYSSLDYLRSFRVSRLKIDRRFITHVTSSADDAAIVRATIGLAQELGIEVLAEGVETAAQRDFLRAAGCKFAQGFYFGRPVTAVAAAKNLRRQRQLAAV